MEQHIQLHEVILPNAKKMINDLGLPIIPLCSHDHETMSDQHKLKCKTPGKAPVVDGWTSKQLERISLPSYPTIYSLFEKQPDMNLGMVLGRTPNYNLVGVDIDGSQALSYWDKITESQDLPPTWEFYTSSGGYRLIFSLPLSFKSKVRVMNLDEKHSEIRFLCQGQQTVVPPSIHPSGIVYEWVEGRSPFETELAEAPEWIMNIIEETVTEIVTPSDLLIQQEPIKEGNRNETMKSHVMRICQRMYFYGKEAAYNASIAHGTDQKMYFPPIEVEEVVAAFEGAWRKVDKQMKNKLEREALLKQIQPVELAKEFIGTYMSNGVFIKFRNDREIFMRTSSDKGPWEYITDKELQDELYSFIYPRYGPKIAEASHVEKVIRALRMCLISDEYVGDPLCGSSNPEINPFIKSFYDSSSIVVNNGVYKWKEDKLEPWQPLVHYHTLGFNLSYKSENENTEVLKAKWEDYLEQWVPEKNARLFLQEYIGYCLTADCSFRALTFLIGTGRNGKSKFIEVIAALFGNMAKTYTVIDTQDKFSKAQIVDKMLLYHHDMSSVVLKETGTLKALVAGEAITVEEKYMKPYTYTNIAKFLIGLNELPRVRDNSDGFFDRVNIVRFPNQFKVNQQFKQNLERDFIKNPDGRFVVFLWAIAGLKRLYSNNQFTKSQSIEEEKFEYKANNDLVLAFTLEILEDHPLSDDGTIPEYKKCVELNELYDIYKYYCEKNSDRPEDLRTFKKSLLRLQYIVKSVYSPNSSKRPMAVIGVKYRDNINEYKFLINLRKVQ